MLTKESDTTLESRELADREREREREREKRGQARSVPLGSSRVTPMLRLILVGEGNEFKELTKKKKRLCLNN
jgi:hypothetical protein